MKVLKIVSAGYEQGGVENGVVLTNALLKKHGYEVLTISSNMRPDLPHYSDVEFSQYPTTGLGKYILMTFNWSAYSITKKALREFQPDIVLLHTLSQPTAAVLFLLKKYPTILFVHGPEIFTKTLLPWYMQAEAYKHASYKVSDLTLSGRMRYYYFKYVSGSLYRIGLRNVDQMIALSKYTLGFLKQEGYQARYIPNGAKLMQPKPMQFDHPVLLYAGRLEKPKGVDDLLRAMPEILAKHPKTQLIIAGEGTMGSELHNLVKQLKLLKSVQFLGHLNPQQLEAAYARCSMLVLPSTWPETFGKVGIEAMSVGRPVIATDVGGVRDWLVDGHNGYLVAPHQPSQISARVIELLSNDKVLQTMGLAAAESAKKFSIEQMTSHIEQLMDQYAH